ncbi:hypothetical protein [Kribbella voronezhensis]|nr:hypothetical protein [Kribbella voronezhensis]
MAYHPHPTDDGNHRVFHRAATQERRLRAGGSGDAGAAWGIT